MKKKWIITGTVILFCIAGLIAFAGNWIRTVNTKKDPPNAQVELKKIYTRYMSTSGYNVSGTITIYDGENNQAFKEKTTFCNIRQGNDFYARLSHLQTFVSDSFLVRLDTVERTVTLSGITREQAAQLSSKVLPWEHLLNDTSSLTVHLTVEEDGDERSLIIKNDFTPEVKSIRIRYNSTSYTILKTEIEWWKTLFIETEADEKKYWLSDIRFNQTQEADINIRDEMNKILTRKGSEISISEKYKGYRLVAIPADAPGGEEELR